MFRPGQVVDKKVNTTVDRQEKLTEEGQQRTTSNLLESFKSLNLKCISKYKVSMFRVNKEVTGRTSCLCSQEVFCSNHEKYKCKDKLPSYPRVLTNKLKNAGNSLQSVTDDEDEDDKKTNSETILIITSS